MPSSTYGLMGARYRMPEQSIPKEAAYEIIHDELLLYGNPRLNLASFVTTWMEPECDRLIMEAINKNYVNLDEYLVTTELQNRCVNIIAHLFNAPVQCTRCREGDRGRSRDSWIIGSNNVGWTSFQEEMAEQEEGTREAI